MDDQRTLLAPATGSSVALPDSGFTALDDEARSQSYRNLAAAAYVYAGVYFVAFWALWIVSTQTRHTGWVVPETRYIVSTILSLLMALLIGRMVQKRRFQVHSFTRIAEWFLILSSLGIAANDWQWQFVKTSADMGGAHWVGVWILGFSATVTLPPRNILRAGFLSSLTLPLVLLTSVQVLGFPPGMENGWGFTRTMILALLVPVWITVGIATVIAKRVFCMARDASKARRLGSYQLEEKLGAGGMGEVWRGSHRLLARPAAIKIIREETLGGSEQAGTLLRRFEREAQATAALSSPHTVQVYDFGITREGTFYYVMELLRGMDLRTLVDRTGPVPAARVLHLLRQACDSLADAHTHGLVHRDIKPANLFVCRQGLTYDFLKVLDFGLVKRTGDAVDGQLTQQGVASGTPGYMAPEVATDASSVDGRADLYALGCVGYWLLTGTNVFTADSALALIVKHVNDPPPPMRQASELDVPAAVESLVMACLAKSPADRPATAQDLGEHIDAVQKQVGAWTPQDAASWWRLHGAELLDVPQKLAAGLHPAPEMS